MDVNRIISELDAEIARLQQIRSALSAVGGASAASPAPETRRRGRPKSTPSAARSTAKKRELSPEGRKRIQEAMKRRWAEHRKKSDA